MKCIFRPNRLVFAWPGLHTGGMAIYSLNIRSVGRSTHAPRTAGANIRYITRPEARAEVLAERMPAERTAARRWLDEQERRDRKNARVIDKIITALPRELHPLQRRKLVRVFAERLTQSRAAWLAAIHQAGKDAGNPHAHIVIRDRDPNTGKRVALLSEQGACQRVRLLWERCVNEALEASGSPQRITRLSCQAQGKKSPSERHRGPYKRFKGVEATYTAPEAFNPLYGVQEAVSRGYHHTLG